MDQTVVVSIAVAVLSGSFAGFGKTLLDNYRASRESRTPQAHVASVDQSLVVVAKARDELEADNDRLRAEAAEERERYAADRAAWAAERLAMRAEVDSLEAKLRLLLDEVSDLKRRHSDEA